MADRQAIYKDLDDKMRVVEVAAKHQLSVPRIYQLINERAANPKPPHVPLRKADPAEVVKAIRAGHSFGEVKGEFGISKGRISQIIAEHDPDAIEAGRRARYERDHDLIWSLTRAWNDDEPVPLIAEMHKLTQAEVYEFVAMNVGGAALAARPRKAEPQAVLAAISAGASTTAQRLCFGVSRQRLYQIRKRHG